MRFHDHFVDLSLRLPIIQKGDGGILLHASLCVHNLHAPHTACVSEVLDISPPGVGPVHLAIPRRIN